MSECDAFISSTSTDSAAKTIVRRSHLRYRQLGTTGLRVSAVGLGANTFGPMISHYVDEADAISIARHAMDLGINHIDTADMYSTGVSETYVGKAVAGRRHEAIIATKVGLSMGDLPNDIGASRGRIMHSAEQSLRRLQTDYIDLYYIHRPDPNTPIEETLRALDDLLRQGKVRYIGCSNFAAWQIAQSLGISDKRGYTGFAVVQSRYNMLDRGLESEVLPCCRALGVGIVPYAPLGGGLLTGKYEFGKPAPAGTRGRGSADIEPRLSDRSTFDLIERWTTFATERGHTLAELAVAWLLSRPEVSSVLTGATSTRQIEDNAKAADWELTAGDVAELDAVPGERT